MLLREVLVRARLRYSHHINVEDAGPVLEVPTDDLVSVRRTRRCTLALTPQQGGQACVVLATSADADPNHGGRSTRARGQVQRSTVAVSGEALALLGAAAGSRAWVTPLGGDGG